MIPFAVDLPEALAYTALAAYPLSWVVLIAWTWLTTRRPDTPADRYCQAVDEQLDAREAAARRARMQERAAVVALFERRGGVVGVSSRRRPGGTWSW